MPEIASKSHLEKMINNRDYSVLINYNHPTRVLTPEHTKKIFNQDLRLLEIRAVLLSCIYYSACMVKDFDMEDIKPLSSEVNGLSLNDESLKMDHLNLHLIKLKNLRVELENDPPTPVPKNVFGSYFGSKLIGLENCKIMLTVCINFIELIQITASSVQKSSDSSSDEWMNKMKVNATDLTNEFEKAVIFCQSTISKTTNETDTSLKLEGRKYILEVLTNMIDVSYIKYYLFKLLKSKIINLNLLFTDVKCFLYTSFICNIFYKTFTKQGNI